MELLSSATPYHATTPPEAVPEKPITSIFPPITLKNANGLVEVSSTPLENASLLLMEDDKYTVESLTTRLITCKTDETLASVMDRMTASQYVRLPVKNGVGPEFIGHIGLDDLLAAYQQEVVSRASDD